MNLAKILTFCMTNDHNNNTIVNIWLVAKYDTYDYNKYTVSFWFQIDWQNDGQGTTWDYLARDIGYAQQRVTIFNRSVYQRSQQIPASYIW